MSSAEMLAPLKVVGNATNTAGSRFGINIASKDRWLRLVSGAIVEEQGRREMTQ